MQNMLNKIRSLHAVYEYMELIDKLAVKEVWLIELHCGRCRLQSLKVGQQSFLLSK